MRSVKGQVLIAVVFLFSIAIFMSVVMFMLLVGGDGGKTVFTKDVDAEINRKLAEVKKRSVVTVTMDDYLWRATSVSRGKYDDKVARKVLSYYASDGGNNIYIDGNSIPKSEVREDLASYFKYKMDNHFVVGANPVSYQFQVDGGASQDIMVKTSGYTPSSAGSQHVYTVAVTNRASDPADSITASLWTSGSGNIYGVTPGGTTGPGSP